MGKQKKRTNKKTVQKKEESVYVGISQPVEVYKNLLGTSKDVVVHLHKLEQIKALRQEKARLLKQFKATINSIKKDISIIESDIPEQKQPLFSQKQSVVEKEEQPVPKPKIETAIQNPHIQHTSDDVTQLESELAEIERKLANL